MNAMRVSIRTKILGAVSLVVLFSMLLMSWWNYEVSKERLKNQILHEELPLLVDDAYINIKNDITPPVLVAALLSKHPFTANLLENEQKNVHKITHYLGFFKDEVSLKNLEAQSNLHLGTDYIVNNVFLASEKTRLRYDGNGQIEKIEQGNKKADWYFDLKKSDKKFQIETNFKDDNLMVFIDHKLEDSTGNFVGIAGVGFYIDTFLEEISSYKSHIYLVDKEGFIKVHHKKRFIQSDTAHVKSVHKNINFIHGISKISEEILNKKNGSQSYQHEQKTMLVNWKYIDELEWYLVIEIDQDDVLASAFTDLQRNLLVTFLVTFLLIFLMLLLIHWIVLIPLHRFKEGVFAFFDFLNHKTDFVEPIRILANDELGKMSQIINKNVVNIKEGIERDDLLIQDAAEVIAIVSQGLLTYRLTAQGTHPALKELGQNVNQMIDTLEKLIGKDINHIIAVMNHYGSMNFEQKIPNPFGEIEKNVNEMGVEIKEATEKIQQQKEEILTQRDNIEEQNRKITDSIRYAKTIQLAILPSYERISQTVPHFIMFEPKDIVSGDFYWFSQKNAKTFLVAADCTGHGVPGAFMSMIGSSLLSHIINEKNIEQPAQILDLLDKGIIKALQQDQMPNDDGMDMGLCLIQEKELVYAGAKNPLVYIKNGIAEEVRGSKKRIGGVSKRKNEAFFEQISIVLDQKTFFYMFSDGFPDQFGGQKKEKFGRERLKNLLVQIHKEDFETQKQVLEQTFADWTNGHAQLDDVLVVGFCL